MIIQEQFLILLETSVPDVDVAKCFAATASTLK